MRFMMMMKANKSSEAGSPPDPRLIAAVVKYTEELTRAGVLLSNGGLAPSAEGARLVASAGTLKVVDGPFTEMKELIAGFAILQAKSKEEAIEYGRRFLKLHQEVLGPSYEGVCEVRQVSGPED